MLAQPLEKVATWICDFRGVPKVGSFTGRMTSSLLDASTILFNPESTVPTSYTDLQAVRL